VRDRSSGKGRLGNSLFAHVKTVWSFRGAHERQRWQPSWQPFCRTLATSGDPGWMTWTPGGIARRCSRKA